MSIRFIIALGLLVSGYNTSVSALEIKPTKENIPPSTGLTKPAITSNNFEQDRQKYQQALNALNSKQIKKFRKLQAELKNYPLAPYLTYEYLRKRLYRLPRKQVNDFLNQYGDTPLAPRLKHKWLRTLATNGKWSLYLDEFDKNVRSTELICYSLWAKHKTGQTTQALSEVQNLWLVSHSQPDACNPIFKLWTQKGHLSEELVWQRFVLAMRARKTQLARYLIRFMPESKQEIARLYREVYFRPFRLKQKALFKTLTPEKETILFHGMQRLARRDAQLAQKLWTDYNQEHIFTKLQNQQMAHYIILGHAKQGNSVEYQQAFATYPYQGEVTLIEAGIKLAIRNQQWSDVIARIDSLPVPAKQMNHWQYWYARAQQKTIADTAISIKTFKALAKKRDYYGFLAADYLNTAYHTNQQSYPVDGNFLEKFKRQPGVIRAYELLKLGNKLDARREWQWATAKFNNDQYYAAAHYAYQINWYSQAIKSAIDAERWHDLKLRFPLAFESEFVSAAKRQGLDVNWLLAVARQESAMMADARSSKGARGLMQLMPRTAKEVSRKHNLRLRNTNELTIPRINISLGSTYLRGLYTRFDKNSIYATAAYNAGPHRVNKWLKKSKHLPLDIWIEQIPFAETRQYVKNVMAYSVIFALKREQNGFRMATAPYLVTSPSAVATTEPEPAIKNPPN